MKCWHSLILAGLALLIGGRAWAREPIVLDPVGPAPVTKEQSVAKGYLKVYSATETHTDGEINYYPHTDYRVYAADGTLFKRVFNAISIHDEDPLVVRLPVGTYTVKARSEDYGLVDVPVVIKSDQITTVHLEHDWKLDSRHVNKATHVQLPNGQVVGWRATPDDASKSACVCPGCRENSCEGI